MPALLTARLQARYVAHESFRMPPFWGSALRGAFGHALKAECCGLESAASCEGCPFTMECLYSYVFETPVPEEFAPGVANAPHPYIVRESGRRPARVRRCGGYKVELVVFGRVADHLGLLLAALDRMGHAGFGEVRGRLGLEAVDQVLPGGATLGVYRKGRGQLRSGAAHSPLKAHVAAPPPPGNVPLSVRFVTPTRIKVPGRSEMASHLGFGLLVKAISWRLRLLADFHGEERWKPPPYEVEPGAVRSVAAGVGRSRFERKSNRQHRRVRQDGLTGEMIYEGRCAGYWSLLKAAEIVGVGKGTSMGLGQLRVTAPAAGRARG